MSSQKITIGSISTKLPPFSTLCNHDNLFWTLTYLVEHLKLRIAPVSGTMGNNLVKVGTNLQNNWDQNVNSFNTKKLGCAERQHFWIFKSVPSNHTNANWQGTFFISSLTECTDFLTVVLCTQVVKPAKQIVKQPDQMFGSLVGGHLCEADYVCEQYANFWHAVHSELSELDVTSFWAGHVIPAHTIIILEN